MDSFENSPLPDWTHFISQFVPMPLSHMLGQFERYFRLCWFFHSVSIVSLLRLDNPPTNNEKPKPILPKLARFAGSVQPWHVS